MKIKQFIFVLLVQLFNISAAAPPIPSKCWLWDSPCLIVKAQAISPNLIAGIPELDIQPLDNILIDFIHIDQEGLQVDLRSMSVKGLSNIIIDVMSVDIPTKLVNLVFHTNLEIQTRYINNGTLLSTPINGDGDFEMKLENVEIAMKIPFDFIKDAHGMDVMILKSYEYTYNVRSGAEFRLENLYYGDKNLSKNMHDKMHKNWKLLTVLYGRYLFDPLTKKIFNSIQNYVHSKPLGSVALYVSE